MIDYQCFSANLGAWGRAGGFELGRSTAQPRVARREGGGKTGFAEVYTNGGRRVL